MAFLSELRLIRGAGKTIGDTNSAEEERKVLDLLSTGIGGFAVSTNGWIPALPQAKGDQYADTALVDGRTLVAGSVQNAIETLTLTSVAASMESRYALERALYDFARLAREFWTTEFQIEPVYLHFKAANAPGAQYALIYSIDVSQSGDPFSDDEAQDLTVVLEREPFWRGVRPGGNPREWTYESRGLVPGKNYNVNDLKLDIGGTNIITESIYNMREWNSTQTGMNKKNWIDIPASSIPGDVPALVEIAIRHTNAGTAKGKVYIGQQVGDASRIGRGNFASGGATPLAFRYASLNAADGTSLNGTTTGADANVPIGINGSAFKRTMTFSVSGTSMVDRIQWLTNEHYTANINRGRYAIFLRCYQSGGADGDVTAQLVFELFDGLYSTSSPFTTPLTRLVTAAAYRLQYMGTVEIPTSGRSLSTALGYGLLEGAYNQMRITLQAARSTGAATVLVSDLVLLPYDLAAAVINAQDVATNVLIADNTGYLSHGVPGDFAYTFDRSDAAVAQAGHVEDLGEIRGVLPKLVPGVNNRLYFLLDLPDGTISLPTDTMDVRLNIVPRWSGVRSE